MNAFMLARRFLRWRAVHTWLGVLSIALAVGMVIALRSLPRAIGAGAAEPAVQFPVLAGRGESASRLVLGVVFLEPPPPAPLPRSTLERVRGVDGIAKAFPLRIEHREGGPIVSTVRAYFRLGQGRLTLSRGRFFDDGEEGATVVGSRVAAKDHLAPGSALERRGLHGTVVGILEATGTPLDDAVFTPLDPSEVSLSAIVIIPDDRFDPDTLARVIAEPGVLVARVDSALRRLVGLVAAVQHIVDWLSWAIAGLAAMLVFSSLYSSAREHARDLAVLRVIGAHRSTLVAVLVCEATIVGTAGSLMGMWVADALLGAATAALSSVGFAFSPSVRPGALPVAAMSTLLAAVAGLAVGSGVYRMDPATALAGVHRPWPEVLGAKGRTRLRRVILATMALLAVFLPSATYRPSPRSRPPDNASIDLFRLLRRWDGEGPVPPEVVALNGQHVDVEGYQYVAFEPGRARGWRSRFFLVLDDPNRLVELFHDDSEHLPKRNERVWIELDDAMEATLYPVHVTGTFVVEPGGAAAGEALYRVVGARARVIALDTD